MVAWRLRRTDAGGNEWAELLAATPHLIFHEPVWAEVTRAGFEGDPYCLLVEREGETVGGLTGFAHRVLWMKFLLMGFPYGGIIGVPPPHDQLASLLGELASREGFTRVRLTTWPNGPAHPTQGLRRLGGSTHLLPIAGRGSGALLESLRPAVQRNIRKAVRSGVVVEPEATAAAVDAFYGLYLEAMERNRAIPKYTRGLVAAVAEHVVQAGRGGILIARREGLILAGILVVDSARTSHYLLGGSRTSGLGYRPNDLLFYRAIRRAMEQGLDAFDFLPSGPDDPGLMRFKSKWGGQEVGVDTLDLVARPVWMRFHDACYSVARLGAVRALMGFVQRRR